MTTPKMKRTPKPKAPPMNEVIVSSGVEGPSLYVNGWRVAGPKPWGGGHTLHAFKCTDEDLAEAMGKKS